jgi:ketosteroid isomerase-like protein
MDDTASSDGAAIDPPDVIRRYQDAHDRHDTETALATFTPDALVIDEGHERKGTDDIRHWLETAATEFTYTRTPVTADALDAKTWLVVNHLEGDFPGGVVDLRYRFQLSGGLISELVIAP